MVNWKGYINYNGTYSLIVQNARDNQDFMLALPSIIDFFSPGEELFIGTYKTDGFNISKKDFCKYEDDILNHFTKYGEYNCILPYDSKRSKKFPSDLTVFKSLKKKETYKILPKVFDFFLETIIFSPQISWNEFKTSFGHYNQLVTYDYVLKGITNYLFAYVDSGDFIMYFDPRKNTPEKVKRQIDQILFSHGL